MILMLGLHSLEFCGNTRLPSSPTELVLTQSFPKPGIGNGKLSQAGGNYIPFH